VNSHLKTWAHQSVTPNTTPAHPQELAVAEFTYLRSVLYMKTFWFCFYFFYIYTCIYGNLICIDIIVVLEN